MTFDAKARVFTTEAEAKAACDKNDSVFKCGRGGVTSYIAARDHNRARAALSKFNLDTCESVQKAVGDPDAALLKRVAAMTPEQQAKLAELLAAHAK